MAAEARVERSIGLFGATGVGVGAIVGGGILALAGVAFAVAGPSAILAFALNGVIAIITALSFAEMSTRFPESGGSYTFAKKVLSVEAAFVVGWVVWFASIVAAVLYALGFAAFALIAVDSIWSAAAGTSPAWLGGRAASVLFAAGAAGLFALGLVRKAAGGGQWINVAKMIVFLVLILGGAWALTKRPVETIGDQLTPFFEFGAAGLVGAMGFTFIALQGFGHISAVAGEVRNPEKNIPRAMLLSLGAALAIYLPFLFVIATVGVEPGQRIAAASRGNEETVIAFAAQNYMGAFGYWFVIAAAVLSMLSALQANLFAASRVAFAMARDRTLPRRFGQLHQTRTTPAWAILLTAACVVGLIVLIPDVAAAGAAASLVFLISYAITHWTTILARMRGGGAMREARASRPHAGQRPAPPFRTPLFPLIPVVGGVACVGLAVFQGIAVPSAGIVALFWLALGVGLYLVLFARRARVVDAASEAFDPTLIRLRGRSPLVLVPIANPANAESMVAVADALTPPGVGRVLLLSVVAPPDEASPDPETKSLVAAQSILRSAMTASFRRKLYPEALATVAPHPWPEIVRVAREHRCESLLIGLGSHDESVGGRPAERLIGSVGCDVVVLRAPGNWRVADVRRILVPVGGRGGHDVLRARLLGNLRRMGAREITYLQVLAEGASESRRAEVERNLLRVGQDEVRGVFDVKAVASSRVSEEIARIAGEYDLVVLGLQRASRRHKFFGDVGLSIARNTDCALIMISRRG